MNEREAYNESKKKKGITTKKKPPIVVPLEPEPDLKNMSKADAVAFRLRKEAAIKAGKEAERKALEESGITPAKSKNMDDTEIAKKDIEAIKVKIRETKESLGKDPDSKRLQNKLTKLEENLNDAEDELSDLES